MESQQNNKKILKKQQKKNKKNKIKKLLSKEVKIKTRFHITNQEKYKTVIQSCRYFAFFDNYIKNPKTSLKDGTILYPKVIVNLEVFKAIFLAIEKDNTLLTKEINNLQQVFGWSHPESFEYCTVSHPFIIKAFYNYKKVGSQLNGRTFIDLCNDNNENINNYDYSIKSDVNNDIANNSIKCVFKSEPIIDTTEATERINEIIDNLVNSIASLSESQDKETDDIIKEAFKTGAKLQSDIMCQYQQILENHKTKKTKGMKSDELQEIKALESMTKGIKNMLETMIGFSPLQQKITRLKELLTLYETALETIYYKIGRTYSIRQAKAIAIQSQDNTNENNQNELENQDNENNQDIDNNNIFFDAPPINNDDINDNI